MKECHTAPMKSYFPAQMMVLTFLLFGEDFESLKMICMYSIEMFVLSWEEKNGR